MRKYCAAFYICTVDSLNICLHTQKKPREIPPGKRYGQNNRTQPLTTTTMMKKTDTDTLFAEHALVSRASAL